VDLLAKAAKDYASKDEFDVQKPYALALSTEHDPLRYQAILVDEGQDFGEEYWLPIELLLERGDGAQLYVFYDPNQAIFQPCATFPDLGPPLPLTENCRNTRHVHDAAYRYYKGEVVAPPEIEGEPLVQLIANGPKAQASQIRDTVSELLGKGGLKPEDIAVLLAGEQKDTYFRALDGIGDPIGADWSFEKLWQPGRVLVDTVRRFKGLEAAAVIVWCAENVDPAVERELLYVALSRARNRLWLAGSAARVAKVLQGT
jgi:superfamily I DNA/RNA helicase